MIMVYLATGANLIKLNFIFTMKINKVNHKVSRKIERIINECITIDTEKRIQSLKQVKEKLLRLNIR